MAESTASVEYAVETRELTKRYGRNVAVDCLDLQVGVGRICGFLGPNGAGKSTTIRMLTGLIRPNHGEIRIFGHRVGRNGPPAAARVGALVENPAFVDYMSARANLVMLAALSGRVDHERIAHVLELVGLSARQNSPVRTFSHGMRQRLGIAQALIPAPRLLILDEPAQGLDPQGLSEVRTLLLHLRDEEGMTIFLSSHLLHEVEMTCDEVFVIHRGRAVAAGDVSRLLAAPGTVAVRTDDPQKAVRVAEGLPFVVEVSALDDGVVLVELAPGHSAELNVALVHAGLQVAALEPRRPTLEKVYMELMAANETAD